MNSNLQRLAATFVLTVGIVVVANGQVGNNPQHLKPVILNVIATDRAGHPVTDLQPGDLRVLDDGQQQPIASLRLNPSHPTPMLVILFDLLDLNFQQSGFEAEQLRKSFAGMTTSAPLYLYVLVANGSLYPVHALPGANAPPTADDAAWIQHASPLLNQALRKVNQARAVEFIAHPEQRFRVTYSALDSMQQEMSRFPGRKQLLWITDGIPSSVRLLGQGWVDLAPRLRQLAAQFNRGGIAIYTLDPSLALATLSRDGLEVLTAATGGRTLVSSDLGMALRQARMDASSSYFLEYGPPLAQNSEGKYHTVRVRCNRKGVRLVSQEAYLAEVDRAPAKAPASVVPPASPAVNPRAVPAAPVRTFVGLVRFIESQSMVLELEDTRFIVVDFNRKPRVSPQPGDRVSVRSMDYDGHGLVADSVSIMRAAAQADTTPPPPLNQQAEGDPVLRQARETEASMDRTLPNFLSREVVKRYENSAQQKGWELQDTLSAEVLYSRKTGETYRDIRVNGKPTQRKWPELGGDISSGEFGSLLHSLLANQDSEFQFIKEDRIDGVAAREYSFRISRAQSDWKILSDYQFIVPQYGGRIWFDRASNRVLRVERTAEAIPSAFPLSSVEAEVNFGQVRMGSTFLLPAHAETRVCIRDNRRCSRKTIDFTGYQQFTGESKITF